GLRNRRRTRIPLGDNLFHIPAVVTCLCRCGAIQLFGPRKRGHDDRTIRTHRMTPQWSENQVTALAPDTSSLTAARKLAGKWSGTGWCGTTLWGLCKGSGRTPYQTIVDLSGPAFRCSCPSRKFPCKHALSLLLLWSGGTVEETGETADF